MADDDSVAMAAGLASRPPPPAPKVVQPRVIADIGARDSGTNRRRVVLERARPARRDVERPARDPIKRGGPNQCLSHILHVYQVVLQAFDRRRPVALTAQGGADHGREGCRAAAAAPLLARSNDVAEPQGPELDAIAVAVVLAALLGEDLGRALGSRHGSRATLVLLVDRTVAMPMPRHRRTRALIPWCQRPLTVVERPEMMAFLLHQLRPTFRFPMPRRPPRSRPPARCAPASTSATPCW